MPDPEGPTPGGAGDRRDTLHPALAAAVLVGLALFYFWPLVGPGAMRSLGGDFAAQTFPWRRYVTEELFAGRLPHWTPFVGFGFPLLADIEVTVFYPISLLVSVAAGPAVSYRMLEIQAALHYPIAGLGMFLLLRRMGAVGIAAMLGAVSLMFSGFFWAHAAHLTIIQSASWGPWVLLGGLGLLERPTTRRILGTGVALALAILGGHPQVPLYIGLGLLVTMIVGGWPQGPAVPTDARQSWRRGLSTLLALAGAGVVGFGLSAVQLFPTAILAKASSRWQQGSDFLRGDSLPVEHLVTLLAPLAFHGTPRWESADEYHGYMGLLPLVLAVWALARPPTRWILGFGAMAALGLVLALGVPPLAWLGSLGTFRAGARALYLFNLGVAGLAGLGFDAFLRGPARGAAAERRLALALGAVALLTGLVALALVVHGLPSSLRGVLSRTFVADYLSFWFLLAGSVIALQLGRRARDRSLVAGSIVFALLLVEVFSFPRALAWPPTPPDRWWAPRADFAWPPAGEIGAYRVLKARALFSQGNELNTGLVFRVPLTSNYSSLILRRHENFYDRFTPQGRLPRREPLYQLMAVRYAITDGDLRALVPSAASEADPDRIVPAGSMTWRVRDTLPRAYLASGMRVLGSREEVLDALGSVSPRETVLLEREPGSCRSLVAASTAGEEVELVADEADRVRLRVRATGPRPLVLSDTYYRGWRATVDGQPTRIYRANYLFRMVCVPPGEHVVEFRFRQPGFVTGALVTAATGLGVAVLLVRPGPASMRWRRRSYARPG